MTVMMQKQHNTFKVMHQNTQNLIISASYEYNHKLVRH
ncbi:unnamed protein product [Brugia timori]|uniref:Transposase n=1 Tax=Brugia timori TaxID=42155 RepID=A0A0R3QW39_9BILA|nr:unnamed protein product [Brugia timori]